MDHFKRAVEFGNALIETGDLDPVYIALTALSREARMRVTLAYIFLYHLGAAASIGEATGADFWDRLDLAAHNEDRSWPRGSERRHWRGRAAVEAARWLRSNYEKPEQVIFRWYNGAEHPTFAEISEQVRKTPSCGPWMAFKAADLMERALGLKVDFTESDLDMYREPRRGAALLLTGNADETIDNTQLRAMAKRLEKAFAGFRAPPDRVRAVNVQECETVLCKYKSYCNGHYPLGKDTVEVYHALAEPRWGGLATLMRKKIAPLAARWDEK